MSTIHLLLVDDERSFVEIMARRLTARGFSVEQTFSGQDASDRLETGGPHGRSPI